MCVNCRYIYNRYSRKHVLVKCGKCPACLQEKANARARKIRNNVTDGTICLFITLTYANDYVPYIDVNDIYENKHVGDINIYRNADIRYVYNRHTNTTSLKKLDKVQIIGSVDCSEISTDDFSKWKHLNGLPRTYFGVCWFADIQNFFKRLRQILLRKYNYERPFSYFTCSEYGGHSLRPHFHPLLFIRRCDEAIFRSAIVEAWPYADKTRTAKFIEIARDASNYVASYVNCSSSLPSFMQNDLFKQKHSHSKGFGTVLDCFSLRSILQKIDSGDLFYYSRKKYDGVSTTNKLPIPLYVLHRYFPLFKGYRWLTSSQFRTILLDPQKVGYILNDCDVQFTFNNNLIQFHRINKLSNPVYHFSSLESYRLYVRITNCIDRFIQQTGLSVYDYIYYYERCYSIYASNMLRLSHENITLLDDYNDFYENIYEYFDCLDEVAPTLSNLSDLQTDPNKRRDIVSKSALFSTIYEQKDKQKKVVNYALSNLNYNV